MIFNNYIHFLDEETFNVKVFSKSGSFVGEGELRFSQKFQSGVSFGFSANIIKFKDNTHFRCELPEGGCYTLIDCVVINNSIYPKLIVKGENKSEEFCNVSILLQGVSQWMDSEGCFEISDLDIIRNREQKVFDVELLDIDGGKFSISCEHWCETKRQKANNHEVNIYTMITCETKSGFWSAPQVIELIHEIKTIFTLLLGFPVGVEYVLDRDESGKMQSVYFLSSISDKNYSTESQYCFVSSAYLFENDKWGDVFSCFFDKKSTDFRNVWYKVAGLMSYEGSWEYEILAYVSLVDRYVSLYAKAIDKKLPDKKFKKVRRSIRALLHEIRGGFAKDSEESHAEYDLIFESIARQTLGLGNSKFSSFAEKFEYALSETDGVIKGIIDLSPEDVAHLIKFRNSVAHGDDPKIKNGNNISYEVVLSNKLKLLLLYWLYRDIGFSDMDFVVFLDNWFHPSVRKARLNKVALDRASGKYLYLDVNKTNFSKAKSYRFGCLVFDYVKASDTYRVNKKHTDDIEKWYSRGISPQKPRSVEEELMSVVDTLKVRNIAYVGSVYIKHEKEVFKINIGACILNCPDYISSSNLFFDRLRVFDYESDQWLPSEFEKGIAMANLDARAVDLN
ncbi:hypothetical protein A9Q81_07720 [Gammaproteobacteria bacterium 42_54_T18]|nr:hypothetical protein A9Q81_07720 [Gammaproteobacteria bacterium 42_54_T18]